MKQTLLVPILVLLAGWSSGALAGCQCVCMDGEVRAICSSSLDIQPICMPRVCPIAPPSVEPVQMPRVAPVGTKSCTQKQIYNEQTGRYEWKEVCS